MEPIYWYIFADCLYVFNTKEEYDNSIRIIKEKLDTDFLFKVDDEPGSVSDQINKIANRWFDYTNCIETFAVIGRMMMRVANLELLKIHWNENTN